MGFYSLVISGTFFRFLLCISDVMSMRTLTNIAVKHEETVTIPCIYEEQYRANYKFWCKGYYWHSCTIVAYANSSTVIDHPAQNMVTVEMNSESGMYWCAAEIGNHWTPDDRQFFYLTVSEDLSVEQSRVHGKEGGTVKIQCFYSTAYQNKQKKWCRLYDETCSTIGGTQTSQTSAGDIKDNGDSFTVEIHQLKKTDAGWYWCSAGELQVPVHISVGTESPGLPGHEMNQNSANRIKSKEMMLSLCIISGVIFLLMVVCLVIWKLKQKNIGLLPVTSKGSSHSLASPASESEVTYSTVSVNHNPTVSPVPRNDVIYSTIKQP